MASSAYLEQCMALRCVVEHGSHPNDSSTTSASKETQQKFVVVPKAVLLSDLTKFILDYLDVTKPPNPEDCSIFIILPNWKPISLADISDTPATTSAMSVLSSLSNIALVRVCMPLQEVSILPSNVMRSLLKSLIPQLSEPVSLTWLKHAGCPLSENVVEAFLENPDEYDFDYNARKEFSEWHSRMCLQYLEQISKASNPYNLPQLTMTPAMLQGMTSGSGLDSGSEDNSNKTLDKSLLDKNRARATRVRTSFDPDLELPMLQKWFAANSHPTRDQMEQYKNALNELPCRKDKRQLDIANIIYWFKNMRAYEKRKFLGVPGMVSNVNINTSSSGAKEDDARPNYCDNGDNDSTFDQGDEDESLMSDAENGELVVAEEAAKSTTNGDSNASELDEDEPQNLSCKSEPSAWQMPFPPLLGTPYFSSSLFNCRSNAGEVLAGDLSSVDLKSLHSLSSSNSMKRRRSRVFIDPSTEIPQLEFWFAQESHPDSRRFQEFADHLNSRPFRLKQPKLEGKNIQLWFKNHRAKVKRERLDVSGVSSPNVQQGLSLTLTPADE